jgi:hypothetical protein
VAWNLLLTVNRDTVAFAECSSLCPNCIRCRRRSTRCLRRCSLSPKPNITIAINMINNRSDVLQTPDVAEEGGIKWLACAWCRYTISLIEQICFPPFYHLPLLLSRERHVEREVYLESLLMMHLVLLKTRLRAVSTAVPASQSAIANACKIWRESVGKC